MTNEEMRKWIDSCDTKYRERRHSDNPIWHELRRVLDEHKLMREALEQIRFQYAAQHGIPLRIPDYIAEEALAKVNK